MTADQIPAAPTKLRQEVRLIFHQIKVPADREVKRQLAVRAFEAGEARAWRRAAHSGQAPSRRTLSPALGPSAADRSTKRP